MSLNEDIVLEIIKKCCLDISNLIKFSNPLEMSKLSEKFNLSGDNAKKLDLLANEILLENLKKCNCIREIGSEEEEQLFKTQYTNGDYMICFDPLDGSSNIGVNITTGTIFALYKYKDGKIKDGTNIVMAGYCLYGGSTQLVVAKETVKIYQLNKFGFFAEKEKNWKIPQKGKYYSVNESNKYDWIDKKNSLFLDNLIKEKYSSRWVGSLVADGHRTLIKGGFFSYPANIKNKNGKIRLLYEAYPFAYIFYIAGGYSLNGKENKFLLEVPYPENNCHQKTPIILSSKYEFDLLLTLIS